MTASPFNIPIGQPPLKICASNGVRGNERHGLEPASFVRSLCLCGGMWLLVRQLRRGELRRYWWQIYFSLQILIVLFNIFGGTKFTSTNLMLFAINLLAWFSLLAVFAVFQRGRAFLAILLVPFLFLGSTSLTRHFTLDQVKAAKGIGDALMERVRDFREETGVTPISLEGLKEYDGQVLPETGLWVIGGSQFHYFRRSGGLKCNLYLHSYLGTT